MSDEERFLARVDRSGPCWMWTGCVITNGYGQAQFGGKPVSAHRVAWTIANGPIPAGAWVLHRCDVKLCVNPTHLYLGTAQDNSNDSVARGQTHRGNRHWARRTPNRVARGVRNGLAKLTEDDVRTIRRLASEGAFQYVIAKQFGVTQANVSEIVRRRTWAHIF